MIAVVKNPEPASRSVTWRWATVEIALIFLVFFVFAGWPAPDVNEAHYLGKAKHYWNPAWCPGDHFLESADAHLVFNWTFGWLTLLLPLSAVAWIGRILTWGLLAWAWQRLSQAVAPRRLMSVLTAGLFLLLIQHLHMAGEWVIGGVEAKGFSFVLVLLAMESVVKNQWRRAWLLLGAASSFHVLVGGWSVLAAGFAWLVSDKSRPKLVSMLPALAGGLLLALPGLIPGLALTWGVNPRTLTEANEIYVIERLKHHLVFLWFDQRYIARHIALIVGWLILCLITRGDARRRRLYGFVGGAVLIAVAGAMVDQVTIQRPDIAASLLRYYWFRLSDACVPMGAALAVGAALLKFERRNPIAASWALVACVLIVAGNLGWNYSTHQQDQRPAADRQSLPTFPEDPKLTKQVYDDWRNVCQWIAENTRPEDRFITPRHQQTFKWYAGRSEVASWKDIPQDAKSLVEWWRRLGELYPPRVQRYGLLARGDQPLTKLAHKYGARYILVDRTRTLGRLGLPRVYPDREQDNWAYEVYLVPEK